MREKIIFDKLWANNFLKMEMAMKGIYRKSYKQPKTSFALPSSAYKVTITRISSYEEYLDIINKIKEKSVNIITKKDIENKSTAEFYVKCIENGLCWIGEDKREIIWEFVTADISFKELADKYNYSEEYLRECYQKYVYGVSHELGENLYL